MKIILKWRLKRWLLNEDNDTLKFNGLTLIKDKKTIPVSFSLRDNLGIPLVKFFLMFDNSGCRIHPVRLYILDRFDNVKKIDKIISVLVELNDLVVSNYGEK